MRSLEMRVSDYKGCVIEMAELPGDRKAYWMLRSAPDPYRELVGVMHEVECGSFEDLERIAKRGINAANERK